MFILSFISSALQFWSVNNASIYQNVELNVYKNIKCFGKISSNWPNDLLEKMHRRLLNLANSRCYQCYNVLILPY